MSSVMPLTAPPVTHILPPATLATPPYLVSLSTTQLHAATFPPSSCLQILAGPGSGKTRVLTSRVAWLILDPSNRIRPEDIFVVTFTNKAAKEMKNRLYKLIGKAKTELLIIGTFHATCARYLRKYARLIDLSNNFTIVDANDSNKIIESIIKPIKPELQAKGVPFKPEYYMSEISKAKARDIDPEAYRKAIPKLLAASKASKNGFAGSPSPYEKETKLATAEIYQKYQDKLKEANNALDFDDLLMKGIHLFRQHPQVVQNVQHVLVDEFQDTNTAQYMLMTLVSRKSCPVSIVGDPDQSIYGWRSAEIGNLDRMRKDFHGTSQVHLEENYRSTGAILGAALKVVQQDRARVDKGLFTTNPQGPPVVQKCHRNAQLEASYIAAEIKRAVAYTGGMLNYSNFVILLRFNFLSRAIEAEFQKQGIANRMMGGHKFYDRMEVKDLLAYLSLADNPGFTPAFIRVVNVPKRGIGDKTVADIVAKASALGVKPMELAELIITKNQKVDGIKPSTKKGLKELVEAVTEVRALANQGRSVSDLIQTLLLRIKYEEYLKKEPEFESRWQNVQELISFSAVVAENADILDVELPDLGIDTDPYALSSSDSSQVDPTPSSEIVSKSSQPKTDASIQSSPAETVGSKRRKTEVIDLTEGDEGSSSKDIQPPSKRRPTPSKKAFGKSLLDRLDDIAENEKKPLPDIISQAVAQDETDEPEASSSGETKTPLRVFLDASILATDVEGGDQDSENAKPKVTISTCHSAKGLEWPVVFVPAVEEGVYPSYFASKPNEIDEERRLLYVAMTRAETMLYLTYSEERMVGPEVRSRVLSNFLSSITHTDQGGSAAADKAFEFSAKVPKLDGKQVSDISKVLRRTKPHPDTIKEAISAHRSSPASRGVGGSRGKRGKAAFSNQGSRTSSLGHFSGSSNLNVPSSSGLGAFSDSALRHNLGFSRPTIGSFSTILDEDNKEAMSIENKLSSSFPGFSRASSANVRDLTGQEHNPSEPSALTVAPPPSFTDDVRLSRKNEGSSTNRSATDLGSFQKAHSDDMKSILNLLPSSGSSSPAPGSIRDNAAESEQQQDSSESSSTPSSVQANKGKKRLGMGGPPASRRKRK